MELPGGPVPSPSPFPCAFPTWGAWVSWEGVSRAGTGRLQTAIPSSLGRERASGPKGCTCRFGRVGAAPDSRTRGWDHISSSGWNLRLVWETSGPLPLRFPIRSDCLFRQKDVSWSSMSLSILALACLPFPLGTGRKRESECSPSREGCSDQSPGARSQQMGASLLSHHGPHSPLHTCLLGS